MLEWLKRHAWKACSRLKRLTGSNPVLSAKAITEVSSSSLDSTSVICFCSAPPQAERDVGAKRRNPERHSERKSGCRSKATKSGKTTSCPTPIGHLSPSRLPVKPAMTAKAAGKYASQRHKVSCASPLTWLAQLTLCWRWPYIAPILSIIFQI